MSTQAHAEHFTAIHSLNLINAGRLPGGEEVEGLCLSGGLERGWPPETTGAERGNDGQTLPLRDGLCFPEAEARGLAKTAAALPGTQRGPRTEVVEAAGPADRPSRSVPTGRP